MKFVGFVSQHRLPSKHCNGTSHDGDAEPGLPRRHGSHDSHKSWSEGDVSAPLSDSGTEEEPQRESGRKTEGNSSPSDSKPERGGGNGMDGKRWTLFPKLCLYFKEIEVNVDFCRLCGQ